VVEDDEHHDEDEGLSGFAVECCEARDGGREWKWERWGIGFVNRRNEIIMKIVTITELDKREIDGKHIIFVLCRAFFFSFLVISISILCIDYPHVHTFSLYLSLLSLAASFRSCLFVTHF